MARRGKVKCVDEREKKKNEMIVVTNWDSKGNRAVVLTGERSTYVNSKSKDVNSKSEDVHSIDN